MKCFLFRCFWYRRPLLAQVAQLWRLLPRDNYPVTRNRSLHARSLYTSWSISHAPHFLRGFCVWSVGIQTAARMQIAARYKVKLKVSFVICAERISEADGWCGEDTVGALWEKMVIEPTFYNFLLWKIKNALSASWFPAVMYSNRTSVTLCMLSCFRFQGRQ